MLKKQFSTKGIPCLSLSLNVPGFPKSNKVSNAFFKWCLLDFKNTLKANLIQLKVEDELQGCDADGDYFIASFSTKLPLKAVKQVCENFEKNHQQGRFLDADLNDKNGNSISSGESKLCFYCGEKPAIECRRKNLHDQNLVRKFMFAKMAEYCHNTRELKITNLLSTFAQKAILSELALTPKPGLVDKFSNGSHTDMNFQTFLDSTSAISPYFSNLIHAGFAFHDPDLTKALPLIRGIGLHMEDEMFKATQGVNTQKGIIFLMGIALFACGKLFNQQQHFSTNEFQSIVKLIGKNLVDNELNSSLKDGKKSHGEEIYLKYGYTGARGEAESGFQMVFEFGWPQLINATELSDEVLIKCFLSIAANNNDTNILFRSNPGVLTRFKNLCRSAFNNFNEQSYLKVIKFCKDENISPGGTADLLVVTIFVWLIINADLQLDFIC